MTKRCRICQKPEGGETFSNVNVHPAPISPRVARRQHTQDVNKDHEAAGLGNLRHKAGGAMARAGGKAGKPVIHVYDKGMGNTGGADDDETNLPPTVLAHNTTSFGHSVDDRISGVVNMMTGRRAYYVMRSNPNKVMRRLFGIKQWDVCRTCWLDYVMVTPDFPEDAAEAGAPD